jgi:hypothetical protein
MPRINSTACGWIVSSTIRAPRDLVEVIEDAVVMVEDTEVASMLDSERGGL